MKILLFLPLLCLISVLPAVAQDNAYDVPKDISYIRLMNFSPDAAEGYRLNGEKMDTVEVQQIGKYYPVKGYAAKLHHGDTVTEKKIQPGRFYSFIQLEGENKFSFYEEKKLLNPAKAFVHFYNLSDRPTLELRSNDGKVLIVPVNQNRMDSRDINATPVTLGVYANRSMVAEVPDIKPEAGKATTIVVIGVQKGLKAIVN